MKNLGLVLSLSFASISAFAATQNLPELRKAA